MQASTGESAVTAGLSQDPRYRLLLAELRRCGWRNVAELAENVGLSYGATAYRLKQLQAAGVVVYHEGMWGLAPGPADASPQEEASFADQRHALASEIRVGQAVTAWTRLLAAQRRMDQLRADLHSACAELSPEETAEYVRQTTPAGE